MTSALLFYLLLPAVILIGVLLWATETQPDRIKRWQREGQSQRAIAQRLGISRHQVRKALA
jgi:DNA invertase Pin-like site-specific DNA recombinase